MLWACEIKHTPYKDRDTEDDAIKLRGFLDRGEAESACWIRLYRDPPNGDFKGYFYAGNDRLRVYEARPIA